MSNYLVQVEAFTAKTKDNDSVMQNPIGEADLEWILHRNCEGIEQLRI